MKREQTRCTNLPDVLVSLLSLISPNGAHQLCSRNSLKLLMQATFAYRHFDSSLFNKLILSNE